MDKMNDCITPVPNGTYEVRHNGELLATCKVHTLADRAEIEENTIIWKRHDGELSPTPAPSSKIIIWNVLKALISWRNGDITYENVANNRVAAEIIFKKVQEKEVEIARAIEANLKN